MELNIHILMNELEHVSGYRGEQDYLDRKLSFYTLYQPGCVLRRDTLYLMESADQALDIPELESGTALLFLGGGQNHWREISRMAAPGSVWTAV
ncbi:hypothetical protein [Blautia marasmi]|uniref:hypothetical protein n=1 Tax=Blautia marasmi TaxID=1917868 RepID=UPI001D07CF3A|nr:hypothetical protein [Blautia marasmi]MCB6193013.1 hypothetical protein [Blautia marasmi]